MPNETENLIRAEHARVPDRRDRPGAEVPRPVEALGERRDKRWDGFVEVIGKAMAMKLADNTDEVLKVLTRHRITRTLAKELTKIARLSGGFAIFAIVDAIVRPAARLQHAADPSEANGRASGLLALAAAV